MIELANRQNVASAGAGPSAAAERPRPGRSRAEFGPSDTDHRAGPCAGARANDRLLPMRIGLVIENLTPRRGGAEQWTLQLATQLLAGGHEVHVAAQSFAPETLRLPLVAHRIAPTRCRTAAAAAAEQALRGLALDVVHDMGAGWYGQVFQSHDGSRLAQWEQKLATLPAWLRPLKRSMVRLLPRYAEFRRLMQRQFADPRRIIVAMSQRVAADFQRFHGIRPEQIRLVYHGIDVERFTPVVCQQRRAAMRRQLGLADDETALLFIGHDFGRKGLAPTIRALSRLTAQGKRARLLVVGHDKRQPLYALLAAWCGVGDRVTFLEAQDDPLPFYAAADVLALPTFYDPFGLVVLEAAACGLPAVTSRQAGVSELLTDGAEGFLLDDPRDDRLLAARLAMLCAPPLRAAMGEAGRQLALRHTLARNCDEIVAIYRELHAARRAAA